MRNLASQTYSEDLPFFGSRVLGNHHYLSDLDIWYRVKSSGQKVHRKLFELEELFQESNLVFKIDLVNYDHCGEEFQKIIDCTCKNFK